MTITYFSLYNCALAGAAAGMSSQRQSLYESSGAAVAPADSNTLLTTASGFATAVDACLATNTPSSATNVLDMVSDGATVIPTTSALASAAAYLPAAMALIAKGAFDGRGIPTDNAIPPVPYSEADWVASNVPNSVCSYFLAFAENVFPDGAGSTVKYVPLANAAMGAAMAGMISGRQDLYGPTGAVVTPTSFPDHVATAKAFATQVDAALQAASSVPTNVTGLVSGSSDDYSTVVPNTAALQNALDSLPVAIGAITKAIFDNRGIPKDNNGVAFVQSDYTDIANSVVAQFLEYANNVQLG